MRNHPLLFLLGFAVGYLPALYFLANANTAPVVASSEVAEPEQITVVLETQEPIDKEKAQAVLAAAEENIDSEENSVETLTPTKSPPPKTPKPLATDAPTATPAPTETPIATIASSATPEPTPVPTETPTPVPTATPDVWAPAEMEGWFAQYSGQYGVDKNVLERIANCESHFNPNAGNGAYLGMFQFSASTWQSYRGPRHMNLDTNPDLRANAEESIKTAAYVIQQSGTSAWPSCLR